MELGLAGRRALVTGGSAGLGLAVARRLAGEGCSLILVARNRGPLEAAAATIREGSDVDVAIEPADLADDDAPQRLLDRYGVVDILVNNAGSIPGGPIEAVSQAELRRGWDLKVFGFIGMCRVYYAAMRERGAGVIANIVGAAGQRVDPMYIAGSTGNAALDALTRALGAQGPEFGVRVVGINPGPIATARMENVLRGRAAAALGDAERWQELTRVFPFGRMGRPDEVAAAVAFLVSPLASYISGAILKVDAGMSERHQWWPVPG